VNTELKYVQRRRYLLWLPLMLAGIAVLVWQVTTWELEYWPTVIGIVMCVPWVYDVPC